LVRSLEKILAQNDAIAANALGLFNLLDDISKIPSDIRRYDNSAGRLRF